MTLYAVIFACGLVAGIVAEKKLGAKVSTDVAAAKAAAAAVETKKAN